MLPNSSPFVIWCRRLIEFGWLFTIILIPSYFNLLSSRHFEPDKAIVLRALVTIMASFAIIHWIYTRANATQQKTPENAQFSWKQWLRTYPLIIAIIAYIAVFLLATITSIVPSVSWWGSYQRLQGTYTNLSYIVLGLLIVRYLSTREQLVRLTGVMILSAIIPTYYGFIQHLQLDPLPWKGDVITRVASTMGNSIFIAAYLILVIPLAIAFAITHFQKAQAPATQPRFFAWQWVLGYLLAIIGAFVIAFAAMQFGAVVRAIDVRFWWVYPGALVCAAAALLLPAWPMHRMPTQRIVMFIPTIITIIYVICTSLSAATSDGVQFIAPSADRFGANWQLWLVAAVLLQIGAAGCFVIAPKGIESAPLIHWAAGVGSSVLSACMLLTIFFTQSRGPWIGGGIGIFTFITLYLIDLMKNSPTHTHIAKRLLVIELIGFTAILTFLLVFNFGNVPALKPLREMPYIGRMGKLFDVSAGTTGDVRMKIWFGDANAGGTIGLIKSNPLRTVVGWGPESMFVAYTPFYPPTLAHEESRSASPDRSHQALLDELVNKGILGLLSYLAVIGFAIVLTFKLLRRTSLMAEYRVLVIAAFSMIVAHNIEGQTGIPIVASLLFLWLAIALLMVIDFHTATSQATTSSETNPIPPTAPIPTGTSSGGRRRNPQRTQSPASRTQSSASDSSIGVWALCAVVGALGLTIAWTCNLDNALADMRFQQGQNYTDSANASGNLDQQIIGMTYYTDAIRMEPEQDLYYLNLGRSLLKYADVRRTQPATATAPAQPINLNALIQQPTPVDLQAFLAPLTASEATQYAEATLRKAHTLNPLNKDHFANMARLYIFWYTRIEAKPEILQKALQWFHDGVAIAPKDVSILNEYIESLLTYANSIKASDPTTAQKTITEADQLLQQSLMLDDKYTDTALRQANVLRAKGEYPKAVAMYTQLIVKNPRVLDSQITSIIRELAAQPELLAQLRDAYNTNLKASDALSISIIGLISSQLNDHDNAILAFSKLAQMQPDSLEAQQNYTLVLSDGQRYADATIQAEKLATLAKNKGVSADNLTLYTQLIEFFKAKAGQ
jgi:tetratricopeptide (TPR) repeat protein/O-antigen ligase